ncbi:DUF2795 domain-containing protein [Pseudomonas sp. 273]|uniref:DUF2795 domain-containing protein n=1 Tax=Pseudomonas sp. 273 TaxID=75692 RepID=UPI0023D89DE2|nr:DUF2795 domain-containing protein [Pseudomonas sp. 273]
MTQGIGGKSPATITPYLKGIDFPANREMLVDQARGNGADSSVIETIGKLPDKDYENMADVMACYSET